MEEDMENFMRFKMMGGNLKSKKNVVPHIFECQPNRPKRLAPRNVIVKRNSARQICEAFLSTAGPSNRTEDETLENTLVQATPCQVEESPALMVNVSRRDIGTQARPTYRSKSTMCCKMDIGTLTHAQTSPIKNITANTSTSPFKFPPTKRPRLNVCTVYTDTSSDDNVECEIADGFASRIVREAQTTDTDTDTSEDSTIPSAEGSDTSVNSEEQIKQTSLKQTRHLAKKHPSRYLGVPDDSMYIVKLLAHKLDYRGTWLQRQDIVFLVLRKIRLNESFCILGDAFGISTSHAARLFGCFTPILAQYLKQLVVWPEEESIRRLLPTQFHARYSKVQSIIDCFEIEIEKPTKAVHQALTWSDYKKCNTLKYLVSATPDGLINFISNGYGGRVSDMILLEDCGYLDKLSEGMEIMADRGFKHIENAVKNKKCTLVRPPSVAADEKLTASQCKETKRIASLRIHIERLIRRIREFKLLTPHACVDIHMVNQVDNIVNITAGLINLQGSLIK